MSREMWKAVKTKVGKTKMVKIKEKNLERKRKKKQ